MYNTTDTINSLALLFHREGFSFCVYDEKGNSGKVSHFNVTHNSRWEVEVIKELDVNLRLRRNYEIVSAGFVSSFFNLVPDFYLNISNDVLLNLSEAEFENNALLTSTTRHENTFVYGTSQLVLDKLNELYSNIKFHHSGKVFLDSLVFSKQNELHLNLYQQNLEAVVTSEKEILFYNLFEIQSDEDILFYTLFALEQLDLDANKIDLKCYGKLLPNTSIYQTLKKYVRHVTPAVKHEEILENYTLLNLTKCASSPEVSEEKE